MLSLPIAQYPDITPPQITISGTYPGATGDVVANNVAAPIEQQVNGADNMIYMNSSSSSTGNYTLNVYFQIGTNPELAQVDVQNRVNLALPQLPQSVQAQGIQVQKKSSAFMMVIAIYSPTRPLRRNVYRELREHLCARCVKADSRRQSVEHLRYA